MSNLSPLVKKLTVWRNNYVAHRGRYHALDRDGFGKKHPLLITEIGELLANGVAIVNRYSDLFVAAHHASGIAGQDDYLDVLEAVRESLKAREIRIQEQTKRIGS